MGDADYEGFFWGGFLATMRLYGRIGEEPHRYMTSTSIMHGERLKTHSPMSLVKERDELRLEVPNSTLQCDNHFTQAQRVLLH